ncbi:uncharacterized protein LALA0_S01e09076g [Lachancea lanzarotensis]|uniref:LALA0S01e09076g1_1 n=1 Tax=Lachancea lanzarotensis TaxID=1245769 RepID=A0A0C7N4F3_9SACH|nr:uncharacterized protein LALA0_S01e09076g [Lachancea lanzarotensis]CEP60366.1 LALA0S01e09076g1_1 [Lachancea lanzarotensis]
MPRKRNCDSLNTSPVEKGIFKFVDAPPESPYAISASRMKSRMKPHPVYNNLHLKFTDFQKRTGRQKLPLLHTMQESENYTTLDPRNTTSLPRLLRLNLALTEIGDVPPRIDLLTNRGDINDLAFGFFPRDYNNYFKINHVAYISRGRLFVWHDQTRCETNFPSLRDRNKWFSGYKFEQACAYCWPASFDEWGIMPKLESPYSTSKVPVLNLLELPLDHNVNALFLAEYDVIRKGKGTKTPAWYLELKCIQPNASAKITWQTISKERALKLLIREGMCMRFFKTCIQCKLAGCETVVYGIRSRDMALVGVRQFQVRELEVRLYQLEPKLYCDYYLKALSNVAELVRTLYQQCHENQFYMMTKDAALAPLKVRPVSRDLVLYPEPMLTELDAILERNENERRTEPRDYNGTKTKFGFTFAPGTVPEQLIKDEIAEADLADLAEELEAIQI